MRWIVGIAVVFALAYALQAGLVVYAAAALGLAYGLGRLAAREGLAKVTAERTVLDEEFEVGDVVEIRVRVVNEGRWPIPWLILEDMLPEAAMRVRPARLKIKGARAAVRSLRPGQATTLKYRLEFLSRGFYPVGPVLIDSGDLFGLYRRARVLTVPKFVTVLPRVVPLAGYEIASRRPIGDVRLTHRLYEDPTRIAGVRPYQPGDPLNRIHWRATARTGRLHSKVYDPSTLVGATILLDLHISGYPARGEPIRSELAATTAASLANAILTIRQQVGLWSNGADAANRYGVGAAEQADSEAEHVQLANAARAAAAVAHAAAEGDLLGVPTRRGDGQLPQIRRLLARLEPGEARPFANFAIEVAPRLPRDATVLAVLPMVTDQHAFALGQLRRQGYAVAAVLVMLGEDDLHPALGKLAAEGIRDVRVLERESQLPELCQAEVRRAVMSVL